MTVHQPPSGESSPSSNTSTSYHLENNTRTQNTMNSEHSQPDSRIRLASSSCVAIPNHASPMFKDRSAAETEAAHDLLELSRSLPPLPPPSVAIGPQSVIEAPASDVQEMTVYQPTEQPIYQVNTIDLTTSTIYSHHHQQQQQPVAAATSIIYDPSTTIVPPTGSVFIPLSPVQEILLTYSTSTIPCTSIVAQQPQQQPLPQPPQQQQLQQQQQQQQQQPPPLQQQQPQQQRIEAAAPLTPPNSECSSDIENSNPNSQPTQKDKEVQTITEQTEGVKPASYTYDTLLVSDGRSKNRSRRTPAAQKNQETEAVEAPETSKTGRYVCCECGILVSILYYNTQQSIESIINNVTVVNTGREGGEKKEKVEEKEEKEEKEEEKEGVGRRKREKEEEGEEKNKKKKTDVHDLQSLPIDSHVNFMESTRMLRHC
ncbi:hypothetical protein EAI_02144 [Harpegnathos saltator]|uniref:Uncharacterized protein n=1 Tax=Harpegnathos saltator TaxID=610380 RepID=E2B830_HARSA|nr:hypothetical protein EAI_02144 [Harpegnathos saltator]